MNRSAFFLLLLALSVLAPLPGVAGDRIEGTMYHDSGWGKFEIEEAEGWKEGSYELPPYPEEGDLLEVPVDISRYTFLIDKRHLTLGEDGVVRYTIVLKSKTGATNVLFEGMRCDEHEYKGYAYGTSNGALNKNLKPEWKGIYRNDSVPFRFDLMSFYFCGENGFPLKPEQIIDRIKNKFTGTAW